MTNQEGSEPEAAGLQQRLRKWLDEGGYPLEMRVMSETLIAGFRAVQSDYYQDPESGEWREIDVVAFLTVRNKEGSGYSRIEYNIECKHSTDPWVLFGGTTSLAAPARVAQRMTNADATQFLMKMAQRKEIQDLPIFQLSENRAYGMTQAFSKGKDAPYVAAMAAMKAAVAATEDARASRDRGVFVFHMALPVVVTDAPLFLCTLTKEKGIALTRVDTADLLWRHGMSGEPHTIIRVMEIEAFQTWIKAARDNVKDLLQSLDWT